FVERNERLAPRCRALIDLERQSRWRQRLRTLKQDVVGFWPIATRNLIDVARTARHNERRRRTGPFNSRVDRDGRSVNKALDLVQVKTRLAHAIEHTGREIGRS